MTGQLIVVSNRIPTEAQPSGGLVVALHDCLTERGGTWIGASANPTNTPKPGLTHLSGGAYDRLSFDLTEAEHEGYYLGYANSVLWPLFHRRADLINVRPGDYATYLGVSERLARDLAAYVQPEDQIWVHDYHFLPLARALRRLGLRNAIGFFLHIPFPTASDVPAMPHAEDLLDWVQAFDVFGVQTEADASRCRVLFESAGDRPGTGGAHEGPMVAPLVCPIGIDALGYRSSAIQSGLDTSMALRPGQKLALGVDRLDYSKGLVQRLNGFAAYLKNRQDDDPQATFLQITPPSRTDVGAYQDVRQELDLTAGSINGAYGEVDWTPIRYIRRGLPRETLAGIYRRADVMLVTPLADGMNLVAKEFVAAQAPDDPGVLILSHFAGAAEQLDQALLVNPYDATEIADALYKALKMPLAERQERHAMLWQSVLSQDITWWTDRFLSALNDAAAERRSAG